MSEISAHKYLISILGAVVLVVLLAAVTHAGSLANTWRLATTRQPQGFYELYFTQPNHLPTSLIHGATAKLSFGLTDHEIANGDVTISATEITGQTARDLSTRTVRLNDGQSFVSSVYFTAPRSGEAYTIRISLKGTNQFIQLQGVAR